MFIDILNITAAPNNGTAGSLDHILQQPRTNRETANITDYKDSEMYFGSADEFNTYINTQACLSKCSLNSNTMVR